MRSEIIYSYSYIIYGGGNRLLYFRVHEGMEMYICIADCDKGPSANHLEIELIVFSVPLVPLLLRNNGNVVITMLCMQ